jgi:uncharacterized protein
LFGPNFKSIREMAGSGLPSGIYFTPAGERDRAPCRNVVGEGQTDMLRSAIVRIVQFCTGRPWPVIIVGAVLLAASALYAAGHFAITTNVEDLISPDLPWHQRSVAFQKAFPQQDILAVVEAPAPELVERATTELAQRLAARRDVLPSVRQLDSGEFFERNGLLFLPADQVSRTTGELAHAQPMLAPLASDPSLRGALTALSFAAGSVQRGGLALDDLVWPLTLAGDTLDKVMAGQDAVFSWQALVAGKPPQPSELRRFIDIQPVLDFAALRPGAAATDAIRQTVADLDLTAKYQATVRLTGQVPMSDDDYGTLRQGAFTNTAITMAAVLVILWLALRSFRIIVAVFISLIVGLATTVALGLIMVGALNLISIAFMVLFVGIGVDFGIQFSVRYRSERHDQHDLRTALRNAAAKVASPLSLAALATAVGFFSFLPTEYRGLSELGEIAGFGMLIAFATSITVLPALLQVLKPPGEPEPMGFAVLAPVDRFLDRHRLPVLVGTFLVVLIGSPLLFHLPFDFNPMDLRDPGTESAATYRELQKDPQTGVNSIDVLAPSVDAADAIAKRLSALPEVAGTMTVSSLIPADQDRKLADIHRARQALGDAISPERVEPSPSDSDIARSLTATAGALSQAAGQTAGRGAAAARRVSGLLLALAKSDSSARARAEAAAGSTLRIALDGLRKALDPQRVALQTLPADLVRNWLAPDGEARVEALPRGNPNDTAVLKQFASSVLAAEPSATGPAVSYYESGRTVVRSFVEAGGWALLAIAVLLWIALRRITDVLLTLVPLLVAGVVTLELCVLIGLKLNFANIIALPLLLGVGVAFKIYYILAWRAGQTGLLHSTLTRAVIFSAMTTATAFGSLWFSSYPGTSSMGKLMALSLACTMAAAVLFQPVLMGPPRRVPAPAPQRPPVTGSRFVRQPWWPWRKVDAGPGGVPVRVEQMVPLRPVDE